MNQVFAMQELIARRERVTKEVISLDDLFQSLFGITVTELNQNPERGELARVSRKIVEILKLKNERSPLQWHTKLPSGEVWHFDSIPEDRLTALKYYYHCVMPHNPLKY